MQINDEDYKVVIGENALRVISQTDWEVRQNAEAEAQEEMAGYLRPKYDVEKIFQAEGDERNKLIVMYVCDIALYHMISSQPQKMGSEIRKERYDRAIKWLESVQSGKIVPDIPLKTGDDGQPSNCPIEYHSQPPLRHNW